MSLKAMTTSQETALPRHHCCGGSSSDNCGSNHSEINEFFPPTCAANLGVRAQGQSEAPFGGEVHEAA